MEKEDLDILYDYGVRHIVDLRSDRAKQRDVSVALDDPRFDLHEYLIKAGEQLPIDREDNVRIYEEMFESAGELSEILHEILRLGRGTLIHCAAGKDRTGVVTSLLLLIAGCDDNAINENYLIGFDDLEEHVARLKIRHPDLTPAYDAKDPTFLMDVGKRICRKYKTKENYYAFLGLTELDLRGLREFMLGE